MNTYFIRFTFGLYRQYYTVTQECSTIIELDYIQLNMADIQEIVLEEVMQSFGKNGTRTEEQCREMFIGEILLITKLT